MNRYSYKRCKAQYLCPICMKNCNCLSQVFAFCFTVEPIAVLRYNIQKSLYDRDTKWLVYLCTIV